MGLRSLEWNGIAFPREDNQDRQEGKNEGGKGLS